MIDSIHIENFKSIVDLKLELGTFNVLIGENGAGKSNILEALAFGAAASANKLDFEFLGSRGIRITNPEVMVSRFENYPLKKRINIGFTVSEENTKEYQYELYNDPNNPKKWIDSKQIVDGQDIRQFIASLIFSNEKNRTRSLDKFLKIAPESVAQLETAIEDLGKVLKDFNTEKDKKLVRDIFDRVIDNRYSNPKISDFIVYAPEQSSLRKFEDTTQIYPLGIRGEGLFQYLKELTADKKNKKILDEIKENMLMLDWYEDFELPTNLLSNEYSLKIKDKFLQSDLEFFDQRSTNEGFLYLLFYSVLFTSKQTPSFFAIDNIDTSFNPKLCVKLVKNLSALANKHKKQVIVTTHNPAILDGLNLKDKNQKLYVVRRNDDGFTTANSVDYKSERKMKLSELWTNGYIGGLPENF